MDKIAERLQEIEWQYANRDLEALAILRNRVQETGKKFGLISYTDLVRGVEFHFPNVNEGAAYQINTYDWSGLDRRIVGDFLGYLCMESYLEAGFMCSALVIGKKKSRPSEIFFEWMEYLDVLPNMEDATVLKFWVGQVKKAHQWYAYGKKI